MVWICAGCGVELPGQYDWHVRAFVGHAGYVPSTAQVACYHEEAPPAPPSREHGPLFRPLPGSRQISALDSLGTLSRVAANGAFRGRVRKK